MKHFLTAALVVAFGILCFGHAIAADQETEAPKPTEQKQERVGDAWPLDTCIVSGDELGGMGTPITKVYEGREIKFCCSGCPKKFDANPEKYLKRADAKIAKEQKDRYPLDYCIDNPSMKLTAENSHDVVIDNRLFVVCSADGEKQIRDNPAKYFAILNDAVIAKQKGAYPLKACPVSGEKLVGGDMGEPINVVYNGELVEFCCNDCVKEFNENPAKYMKMLHDAEKTGTVAPKADAAPAPKADAAPAAK